MKTVQEIQDRPHKNPRTIGQSFIAKTFFERIATFSYEICKNYKHYDSEIYLKDFIKTARSVPERPHENPRTIVQASHKIFPDHI